MHTNKTTYYDLPQYVGTDIINPLTDTNGAYEAIDTAIHNVATAQADDASDITELKNQVGDAVLTTTAQNVSDAVNELDAELETADTGIKARLDSAEDSISTLNSQMSTANDNITSLQSGKADASDVTSLGLRMTEAESDINTLESDSNSLKYYRKTGKNLVCFGDSWTNGTGIAVDGNRSTKRFTAIVARKLGMTEYEFADGGEKFIGGGIQAEIASAVSSLTDEQKANTGIVLIVGGINDYRTLLGTNTASDFATAVVNCANAAHTAFPNALIVLGIGNTCLSYFPKEARNWFDTAIRECEKSLIFPHITIKNLYNVISGLSNLYVSNTPKIHPNDDGHAVFGGYIADAIMGGGNTVDYVVGEVELNSGYAWTGGKGYVVRHDNTLTLTASGMAITTPITGNVTIGSIPSALAPSDNACGIVTRSNAIAGTYIMTASGALHVIASSEIETSSQNGALSWEFGKETNSDE